MYIAAMLHDIGKFTERTKRQKLDKEFNKGRIGHSKYSAQLVHNLIKNSSYFSNFSEQLIDLVFHHHEPNNPLEEIIQLADWLSSSEREKEENTAMYYKVPLQSVFTRLFEDAVDQSKNYSYDLKKLTLQNIFPRTDVEVDNFKYEGLVNSFLNEIDYVGNDVQLYYLLEKYLWCVPAQTTNYVPDISLFDHLRTTAAIALALFDQYESGELTDKDLKEKENCTKEQFMLVNGDVSGIQNFIFSIPTKGAGKSLKGHSVYIELLTEVITYYIIKKLNLKEANILYKGGGNFYLLLPKCLEAKFIEVRKNVLEKLLAVHNGQIYLALDYILLSPADFKEFTQQWDKVKRKIDERKNKKWSEIGLRNNFDKIFGPFDMGTKEKEHCSICGIAASSRAIEKDTETEYQICTLCKSYIKLTNELKTANYYSLEEISEKPATNAEKKIKNYNDILSMFGYRFSFSEKINPAVNNSLIFKVNNTDFLEEGCTGFKIGSFKLPLKDGKQVEFDDLAEKSDGDKKLGYLKLDVDNLGNLFARGFKRENRSISRLASLSRMLGLYFEGYINHLLKEKGWEKDLYIVFSGGDDTFVIGPWNIIFEFAKEFYDRFREYTCYNPAITFSAGIGVYHSHFSLAMAAEQIEDALDDAKEYRYEGEDRPTKDKVSLFGEVFNWEEFNKTLEIKNILLSITNYYSLNKKGKAGTARSLLFRLEKNTVNFKQMLKAAKDNKFDKIKFWRLAYNLRDVRGLKAAEIFIEEYKKIVVDNLLGKPSYENIKNIMVIPAAIKWAQLKTRKVRGREN